MRGWRKLTVLSDRDIEVLFDAHVAMRDIDSSARMRAEIARMIDHVDGVAVEAGQEVQQYGNELDGYRERLRDDMGAKESLNQMVESLIGETTRVRGQDRHLPRAPEEEFRGSRAAARRARAGAGPGADRPD